MAVAVAVASAWVGVRRRRTLSVRGAGGWGGHGRSHYAIRAAHARVCVVLCWRCPCHQWARCCVCVNPQRAFVCFSPGFLAPPHMCTCMHACLHPLTGGTAVTASGPGLRLRLAGRGCQQCGMPHHDGRALQSRAVPQCTASASGRHDAVDCGTQAHRHTYRSRWRVPPLGEPTT